MMSEKKSIKVPRNIALESKRKLNTNLQKIPLGGNDALSCSSDEKNSTPNKNINNNVRHRQTASSYIFEEEPIFSDSDEEKEYSNKISIDQNGFHSTKETSKKVDAEVQCSLISDNSRIMDVINKCASFEDEPNKEFQELIDYCKILQHKYKNVYFENTENVIMRNETNGEHSNGTENKTDKKSMKIIPFTGGEKQLLPSRSGGCSDFSSAEFSINSEFPSIISIIHSLDSFTGNETIKRKSSRIKKCTKINTIGKFIVGKNRQTLKKSKLNLKKNSRNNRTVSERLISHKEKLEKADQKITKIFLRNKRNGGQISKTAARALARNWRDPNKHRERLGMPGGSAWESLQNQIQARRLYTPDDWLHSRELTALCKLNEKRQASL